MIFQSRAERGWMWDTHYKYIFEFPKQIDSDFHRRRMYETSPSWNWERGKNAARQLLCENFLFFSSILSAKINFVDDIWPRAPIMWVFCVFVILIWLLNQVVWTVSSAPPPGQLRLSASPRPKAPCQLSSLTSYPFFPNFCTFGWPREMERTSLDVCAR